MYSIGRVVGGTTYMLHDYPSSTAYASRNIGLAIPATGGSGTSDNQRIVNVASYVDAPSTTSTCTYRLFVRQTNQGTRTTFINRLEIDTNNSSKERGLSWMSLMEVGP
jgi:hypothetical protein